MLENFFRISFQRKNFEPQKGLVNPVRQLFTWTGRRVKTVEKLISLQEPVWAAGGGEIFLSSGPLEWFTAKKRLAQEDLQEATQNDEEEKAEDLRFQIRQLKERIAKLEEKVDREESLGTEHRMKNIKEVSSTDRLMGGMIIRLRLVSNHSYNLVEQHFRFLIGC